MTLSEEIELMYKEINNTMNEVNNNIILLIENTNKILDHTFNKIKIERSEIDSIYETLDNIKGINEDENIFKMREVLQQLENHLDYEENNRSITIKDIEELLNKSREVRQIDKIVKQEPLIPSMLINPISSWRG